MKPIAIIGLYGVGKTTFLKQIEKRGYSVLYTDIFFKECYKKEGICYSLIKEKMGNEFVNDQEVNKQKIKELLLSDLDNINIIEKLVYPILESHLENNHYDFVEIPNLYSKNANFIHYFSKVINITATEKKRCENIEKKNVDKTTAMLNNALNKGQKNKKIVNISIEKITEKNFFENFLKSIFKV